MSQDEDFPIVDAHQHFWDLDRNYYPWLCDHEPIPFRYGDYTALRRNYLPPDYRADTTRHRIVGTVHVEAEWDRAAPVAETPLTRGIRHKPHAEASPSEVRRGHAGSMDDPRWRRGYEALGRHGLSFDLQTPW